MHGSSQGCNLGRDRRRARHSGILGHPDPPGSRVLPVRSPETFEAYGPIGGLIGQRMAAPQAGPEKVPDILPPGQFRKMTYRFVRKRCFVTLSIVGSARGHWKRPNDNTVTRSMRISSSSIYLHWSSEYPVSVTSRSKPSSSTRCVEVRSL